MGRVSHRPAFRESMFIDMHDIESADESTLTLLYIGINIHVVELSILYVKTQVDDTMIILFVALHVKRLQGCNLPKTNFKLRFWCYISLSKVHLSILANYKLKCCLNVFFDYLNVNFQLLFSQFSMQ